MIQAGYGYARDWDASDTPQPEKKTRIRRIRRTYHRVNGQRSLLIKIGLGLFVYALILVYFCIKSATLGYQILALQNDIQQIETANKRMEYQIAQKTALPRVEKVAVEDLGMYKPDENAAVLINVPAKVVKVAANQNNSSPGPSGEKTLEKFYHALSRLARNE